MKSFKKILLYILEFIKNLFDANKVSVTRYFAIFAISVTIFTIVIYFYFSQKIYKESVVVNLHNQSSRIEKSLVDVIEYSAYLMQYLGNQIQERPQDYRYINNLLGSFRLSSDVDDSAPWNIFSWADDKMRIVISSDRLVAKPVDLSDRKYLQKSKEIPERIYLGKPIYGRVSGEWIVPAGMGIIKDKKYIGSLIFGIKISKLENKLWQATTDDNISFSIFDYDMEPIVISESFANNSMRELIKKAINSDKQSGVLKEFSFLGGNKNYGFYQKNQEYSYIIVTKYNDSFLQQTFISKLYSYLFEIWALFVILGLIFYLLRIAIFRPMIQLSIASKLIAQDRDGEAVMPQTKIAEIKELANQLRSIEIHKANLIQAKKSQERFFANMSHELRTPLNGILNFSSMMEKEMFGPMPQDYKEMALDIRQSGEHLLNLVNDILDFSKMDIGKIKLQEEEFSLLDEVRVAIRIVAADIEKKVTLNHSIEEGIEKFFGDRRMFKQILLNLLSNASKFTEKGEISLSIFIDGDDMVLEVRDSGIGIKEEDLSKLAVEFGQVGDGYSRGRKQGSGLGLFLVKKMAELHKGSFEIKSVYGSGTRVIVRFPKARIIK